MKLMDLFRNGFQSSKTVMLNLFQHLKEIPKQARDDTECVVTPSFERGSNDLKLVQQF